MFRLSILFIISFLIYNNLGFKIITQNNFKKCWVVSMKNNINHNYYESKNKNQEEYIKQLNNNKVKLLIAVGPAGTGKTLFACQKAINELKNKNIDKIIITRPTKFNDKDEELGFLPGNIDKKMEPWLKPIFDIFEEFYNTNEINLLLKNKKIEICPLLFMRGRTFKNTLIIADEMQNSSPSMMKTLLTRIGINSKLIITGDLKQSDIKTTNGLYDFIDKYEKNKIKYSSIKIINFVNNDVERSELVKNIIDIYDDNKNDLINTTNLINTKININNNKHNKTITSDCALIPYELLYSKNSKYIN